MNVRTITFTHVRGGPQEGIASVWVELGGGSPMPPSEVITTIVDASGTLALKQVVLTGDLGSENNDLMFAFVKALRDFGYLVRIHTDGQIYPPWFTLATWIVVSLAPAMPWLRFHCQELRYKIDSSEDPEPPFPEKLPACYVFATSLKAANSFVRRSKHPWGILIPDGMVELEIIWRSESIKLRLEK